MPLYEYVATDGTVVELMRPMSEADAPVPDPQGKGRKFTRKLSTFATGGTPGTSSGPTRTLPIGGGCGCGKPHGSCGRN